MADSLPIKLGVMGNNITMAEKTLEWGRVV